MAADRADCSVADSSAGSAGNIPAINATDFQRIASLKIPGKNK